MADKDTLTALVVRWNEGDRGALDEIVDLVYDDLHAIAYRNLERERHHNTFNRTSLVHEAYIKLSEQTGSGWQGHSRFLALAAKVMRNLLIDHARRRNTTRHGGDHTHMPLDENWVGAAPDVEDLLSVDQALTRLEKKNSRMARIVECRFFGGMPHAEIAETLGVSKRTVERDWTRARAYLFNVLSDVGPSPGVNA